MADLDSISQYSSSKLSQKDLYAEADRLNTSTDANTTQGNTRSRSGGGGRFQSYRYPNKMLTDSTDYLKIKVVEYVALDLGNTNGVKSITKEGKTTHTTHTKSTFAKHVEGGMSVETGSSRMRNKKPLAQVILPIPQRISDNNSVRWQKDELNPLQALGIKIGGGLMSGKGMDAITGGNTELEGVKLAGYREAALSALAGMAVGKGANKMISRASGQVMNPNLEILFDGVNIRAFTFEFNFSPRNMSEANQVKQIIRLFKKHSAAKFNNENGMFIKSPDVFIFEYMKGNSAHPFLNVFKPMILNKLDLDYTANQTYSTFHDGTPTSMTMRLNVQELNPVYAEDYDNGEGTRGVGF
jgi:hypothetical protein